MQFEIDDDFNRLIGSGAKGTLSWTRERGLVLFQVDCKKDARK